MGFTVTRAEIEAETKRRAAEKWHKVEVRWPGDNCQRMYRRPEQERPALRTALGLAVPVVCVAALFGAWLSYGGPDPLPVPSDRVAPEVSTAAELPDYSDEYWERKSLRPLADRPVRRASSRIDVLGVHRTREDVRAPDGGSR